MPGPDQLAIMKRFYKKYNWSRYRPATDQLVLEGEYTDATRPLLQVDERGDAILYCPEGSGPKQKILVRMPNGSYEILCFNPRSGEELRFDGAIVENDVFTVPDRPDELDWILTLRRM